MYWAGIIGETMCGSKMQKKYSETEPADGEEIEEVRMSVPNILLIKVKKKIKIFL